jgi:transposase
VAPRYARRTARLTAALRAVGFRMSSEAGAGVLRHLQVHISADTLLRLLRRTNLEPETTPRVLGIDDWAKRKGHTYGTVLVDLERHRVVELLPERESEAVAQWLKAHPGAEVICRDRAEVYAEGAAQGAPDAVQVADRWHLMKNLGEALQRLLERHLPALRAAARQMHERTLMPAPEPAEASPGEQTPAASAVSAAATRRQCLFAEVKALAAQGYSKRAIALQLHIHRQTVDRYLHADTLPPRQQAPQNLSTVTPYLAHIQQRWAQGCIVFLRHHSRRFTLIRAQIGRTWA